MPLPKFGEAGPRRSAVKKFRKRQAAKAANELPARATDESLAAFYLCRALVVAPRLDIRVHGEAEQNRRASRRDPFHFSQRSLPVLAHQRTRGPDLRPKFSRARRKPGNLSHRSAPHASPRSTQPRRARRPLPKVCPAKTSSQLSHSLTRSAQRAPIKDQSMK